MLVDDDHTVAERWMVIRKVDFARWFYLLRKSPFSTSRQFFRPQPAPDHIARLPVLRLLTTSTTDTVIAIFVLIILNILIFVPLLLTTITTDTVIVIFVLTILNILIFYPLLLIIINNSNNISTSSSSSYCNVKHLDLTS